MTAAKFMVEQRYPQKEWVPSISLDPQKENTDLRTVQLTITTEKKLPEKFFDDLHELLTKHT